MLRLILNLLLAYSALVFALPDVEARRRQRDKVIRVTEGQSIQAAIDSAPRGSRIEVGPGVYSQQITIKKNGITLVGKGAKLEPPETFVDNECTRFAGDLPEPLGPTQAGICVTGGDLSLDEYQAEHRKVNSVGKPVKDVTITGFTVSGFLGFNILVLGAENANVYGNTLENGPVYGFLTAGSRNTRVTDNKISSAVPGFNFVALCMDNFSKVKVSHNRISDYFVGLCVQTDGADVEENEVSNVCYGAFVDPGVQGARVRNNHITGVNPICESFGGVAGGVQMSGSIGTKVEGNYIEGFSGAQAAGVGIVDELCQFPSLGCIKFGPPPIIAKDNRVKGNTFGVNPLDIFLGAPGNGNVVKNNDCDLSVPPELCA